VFQRFRFFSGFLTAKVAGMRETIRGDTIALVIGLPILEVVRLPVSKPNTNNQYRPIFGYHIKTRTYLDTICTLIVLHLCSVW